MKLIHIYIYISIFDYLFQGERFSVRYNGFLVSVKNLNVVFFCFLQYYRVEFRASIFNVQSDYFHFVVGEVLVLN